MKKLILLILSLLLFTSCYQNLNSDVLYHDTILVDGVMYKKDYDVKDIIVDYNNTLYIDELKNNVFKLNSGAYYINENEPLIYSPCYKENCFLLSHLFPIDESLISIQISINQSLYDLSKSDFLKVKKYLKEATFSKMENVGEDIYIILNYKDNSQNKIRYFIDSNNTLSGFSIDKKIIEIIEVFCKDECQKCEIDC